MGFFSWIAQDTGLSVANVHSSQYGSLNAMGFGVVYMTDGKNVWEEKAYDGYGKFGGKDYYELFAELNGYTVGRLGEHDPDWLRNKGIQLSFGVSGIVHRLNHHDMFLAQGIDFFNWQDQKLVGDLSANELIELGDYVPIQIKQKNLKYPNIVHNVLDWKYNPRLEPKDCDAQGYFY